MFSFIWGHWDLALLWGLIIFGIFSALNVIDNSTLDNIATDTNTTVYRKATDFAIWGMTFNALNPTFRYRLPFTDRYIIPINDIPAFDPADLLIIVPLLFIVNLIFKKVVIHEHPLVDRLIKIFIMVLLVVLGLLIAKLIWYLLYLWASTRIGMPVDIAIATREAMLENIGELNTPLAILAMLGATSIYRRIKENL